MAFNGWKVTAIIFMFTTVLLISLFVIAANTGFDYMEKEAECAVNICDDSHDAYFYDTYSKICTCYTNGMEVKHKLLI